jgi:hypothetical protein
MANDIYRVITGTICNKVGVRRLNTQRFSKPPSQSLRTSLPLPASNTLLLWRVFEKSFLPSKNNITEN